MHKNRRTVRVEWGHCDAAKIVYYPRYFEWFDQATHHLFETAGINLHAIAGENGHSGAPLVNATAKFISPSRHGDDIEIESEFVELGRASFKVAHRIYNRGTLAVEGLETRVWAAVDPANPGKLKAMPIPPEMLARMKGA
jgi:4-hydroxybenzoyl-CoA thioesterase